VDLVLGRSAGLGSTLFVPVFLPGVPIVNLFDYFYHTHSNDLAGEAGAHTPPQYFHWRRAAGAMDLLDLENGVTPWTLTDWQRDLFPLEYRDDFEVLFDGVCDRRFYRKRAGPRIVRGRTIPPETRLVTFVSRHLDRTRGFDRFIDLANRLLRSRSDVVCAVVGSSPVQRMLDVEFYNKDYAAHVLGQVPPHDPERLWLLGPATPDAVAELLAMSDVYVYPSRPYIVSRSLVEAMSAGCVVLAADEEPVREFITHEETGLLIPSDDRDAWEQAARVVLDAPASFRPLGERAAALVREKYSQEVTMPQLAALLGQLVD
jgi:glycosyltransferase involved in cell wall biosynthesis